MTARPHSPAAERNSAAILGVLRHEFQNVRSVLEIGSGTGQHAVAFASDLSHLTWQPSDVASQQSGMRAWWEHARLPNVLPPLSLDVTKDARQHCAYDAVFSANTAHIMAIESVRKMYGLAADVLSENGIFCLYGPFRLNGKFTSRSNEDFHRSLVHQNPSMGIRNLEELDTFGTEHGLHRHRLYAMPANNLLGVWSTQAGEGD